MGSALATSIVVAAQGEPGPYLPPSLPSEIPAGLPAEHTTELHYEVNLVLLAVLTGRQHLAPSVSEASWQLCY